jgi:hypothetical protein
VQQDSVCPRRKAKGIRDYASLKGRTIDLLLEKEIRVGIRSERLIGISTTSTATTTAIATKSAAESREGAKFSILMLVQ